jgi:hypothetical protein
VETMADFFNRIGRNEAFIKLTMALLLTPD